MFQLATPSESHFLRFFSGSGTFPNPAIIWDQGDSFRLATNAGGSNELLNLKSDGTMYLNSNNGIALDQGNRPLTTR